MNDLDVTFEQSPWEAFLMTKQMGDTISAANLLTMLEAEEEQAVEDALQEYLSYRQDAGKKDPLFTGAGNRSRERLSLTSISAIFKDLFRKAGYDSSKLTAHSLMHTSNTLLFRSGADLFTVQQHARHSDPKTTEIYLHMAEREEDRSEQQIYTQIFSAERNRIISQLTATLSELTTEELAEALRYVEGLRQEKNLSLLAK